MSAVAYSELKALLLSMRVCAVTIPPFSLLWGTEEAWQDRGAITIYSRKSSEVIQCRSVFIKV